MKLDFLNYWKIYAAISGVLLGLSIYGLVVYGLKSGLDFTGGSLLELSFEGASSVSVADLSAQIAAITSVSSIQPTQESIIIRSQQMSSQDSQAIRELLSSEYGMVSELRFESVGPTLGRELLIKTLFAVLLGSAAITAYVAFQFKELSYGVCAILAMVHDTLIVMGVFAWLGRWYGVEVDTLFVTALLITLAFSIHDTIVVYDRIRESIRRLGLTDFTQVINKAVAETLVRSINNSLTTIFMLLALFLLGGESIRWFVFALLIGTIIGTYSSPFTAAPLLALWHRLRDKRD